MTNISKITQDILKTLSSKWSLEIMITIKNFELTGFNQLQNNLPRLSHKVLSERLAEMLDLNLISRTVVEEIPLRVIYKLTPKGQTLLNFVSQINQHLINN
ncbi:MAG: helix-turn-helix transcriptional regulator [Lactobacillaceae bacterium]|jgi:DNA-binding HxlR family transcriptional regulator|nr:helix-turn-helix transcriptional regulator [Lactobacillaceae bacterium]